MTASRAAVLGPPDAVTPAVRPWRGGTSGPPSATYRAGRPSAAAARTRETGGEAPHGAPLRTLVRSVRLPAGARGDEAGAEHAEYEDGVLTIKVPVPEEKTGTRTIQVRHV
ncbi:Hsp20 family protein [Streptomyces sp. NPDC047453]|uniref:Hsp20 family protein n=1 Tax=Streptomyces sp. NPDC047453 TaxID=3154812 RepID=UPI0033E51FF1